jgi:hypothetical protein
MHIYAVKIYMNKKAVLSFAGEENRWLNQLERQPLIEDAQLGRSTTTKGTGVTYLGRNVRDVASFCDAL